jgi:hypothetical protein
MTANHFRHGPSLPTLPMSGHADLHSTPLADGDQTSRVALECTCRPETGPRHRSQLARSHRLSPPVTTNRVHNPFGSPATYA